MARSVLRLLAIGLLVMMAALAVAAAVVSTAGAAHWAFFQGESAATIARLSDDLMRISNSEI
ncbi:MAG: hypothetical protein OIF40_12225 [Mangrovicoccus sp.]|nr:hypothetical protein [Mangrovicoccus sp.]